MANNVVLSICNKHLHIYCKQEAVMTQSERQLLVDGLPFPTIVIAGDERILALNERANTLFAKEGLGRHYITVLRQPSVLDAIETCLATGNATQCQYSGREGDRDTTWRVNVAPQDLDGKRGAVLVFEDITASEQAGQMRRDFVANVSHELRTPLTALLGFIETLKGPAKDDPDARDRFLGIMENEAGRMARLVDDLLSLSRVEDEERVKPNQQVQIAGLIQSVVDALSPLAQRSNLSLKFAPPNDDIAILGDSEQLRQILNNLIENAIKYAPLGEHVTVQLSGPQYEPVLRQDGVQISVIDHGDGIASHQIARLTERFYRVDSHRSRQVGGTGLGLAIVKHIVNRHRGRLRIKSALGQGSCFTIILPLG